MTGQEILDLLNNYSYCDIAYNMFSKEDFEKFGEIDEVEDYGGEDMGSTRYKVFYFKDHNVYIRIDGYYLSHDGSHWEDAPYIVTPKEKTIIVYE